MYKKLFLLTLILILNRINSAQINPYVQSVINQVSIDTLYENLKALTGEKDVTTLAGTFKITSRHASQYTNIVAEDYLNARLNAYKLNSTIERFTGSGGNIIAVQEGFKYPDQKVIICAHFDCMPNAYIAPGADDNASGTSAVLEAARILSKYKTDYTIIYALFDNEEQGLLGSSEYAFKAKLRNDKIVAVINLDMIGWDSNNDFLAEVHYRDISTSFSIADNLGRVNNTYGIGLNLVAVNPGTTASDHSPFWNQGYPAILLIEDYNANNGSRDFHPYYHTANDHINYINKNYFEKCAKVAIGALATYAGIQSLTSRENEVPLSFNLFQNSPNPFNPSTVISYQLATASKVLLKVYDLLGKEVATLVDEFQQPGFYHSQFSIHNSSPHLTRVGASQLSSGVYFYALYTNEFVSVKKMILTK